MKKKVKTIEMVNFILTKTDEKMKIDNKSYDWTISYSNTTDVYMVMTSFIEHNSTDELENLITMLYYTSNTLFTDLKFTESVSTYFSEKLKMAQEKLDEVTEESEKRDLQAVKDIKNG